MIFSGFSNLISYFLIVILKSIITDDNNVFVWFKLSIKRKSAKIFSRWGEWGITLMSVIWRQF